jgi:hypothetical protein
MRNQLIFLLFFFTTANAQRQRYDGYIPTTGDSHTKVPYGSITDSWQNLNNASTVNPLKFTADFTTNNLLSHIHNYPIVLFNPKTNITGILNFPEIQSIRIIDGRYDVKKVGFFPCDHSFREKQLFMVGLQLQGNFAGWLKENFIDKIIIIDSNNTNKRQLVILVKKFWYSFSAAEPIATVKNDLITTLHYRFDIFSSKDIGYYPLKRIEGSFSQKYNNNKAYNTLTDSVLLLLKNQLGKLQFESNEVENKWMAPADFVDYCNKDFKSLQNFEKKKKGLYESYQDFLANNPVADSVIMITKYSNSGNAVLYACQIAAYQNSEPLSGTKAWGYFDGETIFLNTGNGFYIKLILSGDDYLFLFLKNIGNDKINAEMQRRILINDTPYKLLKKFTASYSIIYQFDYTTGKLF